MARAHGIPYTLAEAARLAEQRKADALQAASKAAAAVPGGVSKAAAAVPGGASKAAAAVPGGASKAAAAVPGGASNIAFGSQPPLRVPFVTIEVDAEHTPTFVQQPGLLPAMLRELLDARCAVRKAMANMEGDDRVLLDKRQLAIKVLANSVCVFVLFCLFSIRWMCLQ